MKHWYISYNVKYYEEHEYEYIGKKAVETIGFYGFQCTCKKDDALDWEIANKACKEDFESKDIDYVKDKGYNIVVLGWSEEFCPKEEEANQ